MPSYASKILGHRGRATSPIVNAVSDSGNDLDPSLVHCLEPLSLLLGVLVSDGADEVVASAILVDLARVPPVALIN
jgi:hypothetical protein